MPAHYPFGNSELHLLRDVAVLHPHHYYFEVRGLRGAPLLELVPVPNLEIFTYFISTLHLSPCVIVKDPIGEIQNCAAIG